MPDLPQILPAKAREFLTEIEPILATKTCRSYRWSLVGFHKWLLAHQQSIDAITRSDMALWLHDMHKRGLAPATRALQISGVRQYLRFLESRGWLKTPVSLLLTPKDFPKLPRPLPRALRPEHDRQLCDLWKTSNRLSWLGLLLMRQTGIRVGELVDLPYNCVDFRPENTPYLRVPVGKTASERLVPISDAVVDLIKRAQSIGRPDRQTLMASCRGRSAGSPIATSVMGYALRCAVNQLGLRDDKPITTHRLRHSYATSMLHAGMGLVSLKEILGHLNINMTLRYAKPTVDLLHDEYETALAASEQRYDLSSLHPPGDADVTTASAMLNALVHTIERNARERTNQQRQQARNIVKRLERIGEKLAELHL